MNMHGQLETGSDIRTLLRDELPRIRREYVQLWQQLADGTKHVNVRRAVRTQLSRFAADLEQQIQHITGLSQQLSGEDQSNAEVLHQQLNRILVAAHKLGRLSAHAVLSAEDIRPDTVGCGRRFRRPATADVSRALPLDRSQTNRARTTRRPQQR